MTVDTSGLAAAQSRVAQIQSMFGQPAAPVQAPPRSDLAFQSAMSRAQDASAAPTATNAQTSGSQTATSSAASAASTTSTARSTRAAAASSSSSTSSTPATSSGGLQNADAVLETARKYLGVPYLWGGTDPRRGLDCSGFLQLVFKQHGIDLPRVARDQARQGTKVNSLAEAKPGDIVAFNSPVSHIGIYVGDGKMIHAPRTGKNVSITPVHRNITAIRRLLPEAAPTPAETPAAAPAAAPAAGAPTVSNAQLASAVRNAAIAPAVSPGAQAATWEAVVASAVNQSLVGTDVQGGNALASVLAGLGSATPGATIGAAFGGTALGGAAVGAVSNAMTAGTRPATALAPDAVGTRALNQAPAQYRDLFIAAEQKYGVPATLLAAVAKQESNFKPRAVSRAGAQGLMQIMPGTARGLGITNAFDPEQAVDGAARYLRQHLRTFGSTELALAAYNAGAGNVRKYDGIPPFRETQNYVRKIMADLRAGVAA
ncbi:MAG: transglycosylase SLT domain-containing protein [Mobilicoccus sp.]|nr:transglycosylase SLT domain-containing protein [Mobilicoccus sp.]